MGGMVNSSMEIDNLDNPISSSHTISPSLLLPHTFSTARGSLSLSLSLYLALEVIEVIDSIDEFTVPPLVLSPPSFGQCLANQWMSVCPQLSWPSVDLTLPCYLVVWARYRKVYSNHSTLG